jgi:hypothetical protein
MPSASFQYCSLSGSCSLLGSTEVTQKRCRRATLSRFDYGRLRTARRAGAGMCHAKTAMRDPETIETELMEISAIPDDVVKLERIVAWCASHPDEVPFAMHQLMERWERAPAKMSHKEPAPDQS